MIALIQECSRELYFFLGPSETLYVLAGNYRQYINWVAERPGLTCRFIQNVDSLRGLQFPLVTRTGTWEDRRDLHPIERRFFEIGATDTEYPAGTYTPFSKYSKWTGRHG